MQPPGSFRVQDTIPDRLFRRHLADNIGMLQALLFLLFLVPSAAFAQPDLLIKNAASPFSARQPQIAPRSLIEVRLDPFDDVPSGDSAPTQPIDFNQPLSLAIQPEGSAEALPVEILATNFFVVIAVLPSELPLGPATATLTYNGGSTSSGGVEIVAVSFVLFTHGSWAGPALAQNVSAASGVELNGLTRPALPGDYITLWGTGLGHSGQADVEVLLDGKPVAIQYAGPAPNLEGLDQINILVSPDAEIANGCYVPLQAGVLGESSNPVSITKVDTPGPCTHPLGLSEEQMQRLDAGDTVPIGAIGLYSTIAPPALAFAPAPPRNAMTRYEQASAMFFAMDAAGVASRSRTAETGPLGCRLNRAPFDSIAGSFISVGDEVSVGDAVTVSGPENRSLELPREGPAIPSYRHTFETPEFVEDPADLPTPFFTAGEWQVSAPGSADAEPLQAQVLLPPLVEVTNFEQVRTVERSAGMTILWDAQGYRTSDTMMIQILGRQPAVEEGEAPAPLSVECNVPALDGQITIEPAQLEPFEPTGPDAPTLLSLTIHGPPREESLFTTELTSGEVIPGLISYGWGESFAIELQ